MVLPWESKEDRELILGPAAAVKVTYAAAMIRQIGVASLPSKGKTQVFNWVNRHLGLLGYGFNHRDSQCSLGVTVFCTVYPSYQRTLCFPPHEHDISFKMQPW